MSRRDYKYKFSSDWTTHHFENWERWFGHFRGEQTHALEIGSWEGRSAIWFLQNVLTHPISDLICIDSWSDENSRKNFIDNVFKRASAGSKVWAIQGTSDWLKDHNPGFFDFVYIDADHSAEWVLRDATNVVPFVKEGGLVLFDDYADFPGVKEAVGVFIDRNRDFEVVEFDAQVLLRRKVSVTSAEGNTAPEPARSPTLSAPADDPHCSECHAPYEFSVVNLSVYAVNHNRSCSQSPYFDRSADIMDTAFADDGSGGD